MANGDFKDLTKRTASDKIFRDKALSIAKKPKYDEYQLGLASMVYTFFDKKLLVVVLKMRVCQTSNKQKNYTNQLLQNLIKEKYSQLL